MEIRNETEIQLLKILFKTNGSKATKNITSRRAYPHGIENKYYRKLKGFFQPLIDYVESYLDKNMEALLKGDSKEFNVDSIPGKTFRNMIFNMENWLSIYMPDISELPADSNNNIILTSIGQTANEAKEFGDKEFNKALEKGIHVNLPLSSPWWDDMKSSWAEDNYTLITSNAKNYVSKINTLTEQAIVNGLSPAKLSDEIRKATTGLSDKHCKLLARDQMGKLNGQITQAQMEEIGLDLYVWSTAYDDRVRDSHAIMEGLLCRWDDASLCSYDGGKTWTNRPSGAIDLHPGQDIQCRCVALSYYPELVSEMEGTPIEYVSESEILNEIDPNYNVEKAGKQFIKDGILIQNDDFKNYIYEVFDDTKVEYAFMMSNLVKNYPKSIVYKHEPKVLSRYTPELKSILITHADYNGTLRHEAAHFFDDIKTTKIKAYIENSPIPVEYKFPFSQSLSFSKVYLKESKNLVDSLEKEIKDSIKSGKFIPSFVKSETLENYLSKFYKFNNREIYTIADIFTAVKGEKFGGHSPDYFYKNMKKKVKWQDNDISNAINNENRLKEGFAGLCEHYYAKSGIEFKKFLDKYFNKSISVIQNELTNLSL